jgi:hypothetical protein
MSSAVNSSVNICARTVLNPYQERKIDTGATAQKLAGLAPDRRAAARQAIAMPAVSASLSSSSPDPPRPTPAAKSTAPVPHSWWIEGSTVSV